MALRSKSPCRARISEGTAMGQVLFGDFFSSPCQKHRRNGSNDHGCYALMAPPGCSIGNCSHCLELSIVAGSQVSPGTGCLQPSLGAGAMWPQRS